MSIMSNVNVLLGDIYQCLKPSVLTRERVFKPNTNIHLQSFW